MNQEQLPLLPAYGDKTLSVEAAQQLVQMSEDASISTHMGEDLLTADKADLLRKAKLLQKSA